MRTGSPSPTNSANPSREFRGPLVLAAVVVACFAASVFARDDAIVALPEGVREPQPGMNAKQYASQLLLDARRASARGNHTRAITIAEYAESLPAEWSPRELTPTRFLKQLRATAVFRPAQPTPGDRPPEPAIVAREYTADPETPTVTVDETPGRSLFDDEDFWEAPETPTTIVEVDPTNVDGDEVKRAIAHETVELPAELPIDGAEPDVTTAIAPLPPAGLHTLPREFAETFEFPPRSLDERAAETKPAPASTPAAAPAPEESTSDIVLPIVAAVAASLIAIAVVAGITMYALKRQIDRGQGVVFRVEVVNADGTPQTQYVTLPPGSMPFPVDGAAPQTPSKPSKNTVVADMANADQQAMIAAAMGSTFDAEQRRRDEEERERQDAIMKELLDQNLALQSELAELDEDDDGPDVLPIAA